MDEDRAFWQRLIGDIAQDYRLNPKIAQALLEKILAILRQHSILPKDGKGDNG